MSPTDDIFAIPTYSQPKPPSKPAFAAWHKPRKQVVRSLQWRTEFEWLSMQRPVGATIKYLGLPGADMLDLRYLTARPEAQQRDQFLWFLGFDRSAKPGMPGHERLNISERELRDLPTVDIRSRVFSDDFKFIADDDSVAWKAADEFEYFDLINLDLCGSLVSEEPDLTTSNYDAILSLMGFQRYQRRPWSLLLTTRIGPDKVHSQVMANLWDLFDTNRQGCEPFASAVDEHFGFRAEQKTDLSVCTQREFFNVMVAALSKWMLKYAIDIHCRMEVSSAAAYQVYGGSGDVDMASLIFRFIPEAGLATSDPASLSLRRPVDLNECELATPIPAIVAQVLDIDAYLADDDVIRETYTNESADLMELAHYKRSEYLNWVATQITQG